MRMSVAFLFYSLLSTQLFAGVDINELTRVSTETKVNCVEFYQYKGELYCSSKPLSSQAPNVSTFVKDRQNIQFDSRPWRMAWTQTTPQVITIEYVPEKDDIKNWSELITSQYVPGIQDRLSAMQFVHLAIKQLQDTGLKAETAILYQSPDTVIFEFRISSPTHLRQHELQKVHRGKDGFYILHYVIKKERMSEQEQKKWLENMQRSTVIASEDNL